MPAIDSCEPAVIHALQKEGWRIVKHSVPIKLGQRLILADLRLQRGDEQIIVVEVKCFRDYREVIADLYTAIGQYMLYRNGLARMGIYAPLYLAIPHTIYQEIFQIDVVQDTVLDAKIRLIAVDLVNEVVIQWLP
jgi:hypothetical protein